MIDADDRKEEVSYYIWELFKSQLGITDLKDPLKVYQYTFQELYRMNYTSNDWIQPL